MTGTPTSYQRAVAVTPSDTVDFGPVDAGFPHAGGLYIGVAGSLVITTPAGDTVTFSNVVPGHLRVAARRVFATGTTATGIVALY